LGGELAKAAFDNGFEEYGIDILTRYYQMISDKGETYLWYFPDGAPSSAETSTSPEATPTDGWGSSAMLYALIQGLAGVEDKHKLFEKAQISPRWLAAEILEAEVQVCYENTNASIGYNIKYKEDTVQLEITCLQSELFFHVLLPDNSTVKNVKINGKDVNFSIASIEKSKYVDFEGRVEGGAEIKIGL